MTFVFNILALLTVCATGMMHWFGVEHSFYWMYPWWDIPTHLLGGITVGFWTAAVSTRFALPPRRAALFIVRLALMVGVAWEIWEAVEGVGGGYGGYWFDTVKDLFDDVFGALAAWVIYALYRN